MGNGKRETSQERPSHAPSGYDPQRRRLVSHFPFPVSRSSRSPLSPTALAQILGLAAAKQA